MERVLFGKKRCSLTLLRDYVDDSTVVPKSECTGRSFIDEISKYATSLTNQADCTFNLELKQVGTKKTRMKPALISFWPPALFST